MSYISTGKAAKLLSVTPDAVLKWIKGGKLRARKTAGGHYRVSLDLVQELLKEEGATSAEDTLRHERRLVPCWEYNAIEGRIKEQCRTCLVFRAKGTKCYEVGRYLKEKGEGATCCATACEECTYYKEHLRRPVNVLVYSNDKAFMESLTSEAISSHIRFRFIASEYDCSLAVESFRPEYVILDCKADSLKCNNLCERLASDPRIPDVKILLPLPARKTCKIGIRENIIVVDRPKNVAEIETLMGRFETSS
jgi:excisionase family DNA binding protein